MNKSFTDNEDEGATGAGAGAGASTKKNNKQNDHNLIPVLVSLNQLKNQQPKLQLWNLRTGALFTTINTDHTDIINGLAKTSDYKVITYSKDATIKIYY